MQPSANLSDNLSNKAEILIKLVITNPELYIGCFSFLDGDHGIMEAEKDLSGHPV